MVDLKYDTRVHKPLHKNLSGASSGYGGSIRDSQISVASSRYSRISWPPDVFEDQSSAKTFVAMDPTKEECLSANPELQMCPITHLDLLPKDPRERSSAFGENSENIKSKCKAFKLK